MKKLCYYLILLIISLQCQGFATNNKFFKFSQNSKNPLLNRVSNQFVSFIYASNSINGPFTSPAILSTYDSLFIKMDVSPGGSVEAFYIIDINENGIIDNPDFMIGNEIFEDNNTQPGKPIDLDPNLGIILTYLETGMIPAMQVIAHAIEGETQAQGIVIFENPPAPYLLTGKVYDSQGNIIQGAAVFVFNNMMKGDLSNVEGLYQIPVDTGLTFIHVEDLRGRYNSFDTIITITENTYLDFYLKEYTSYIRGYVRDENMNPIAGARIWVENVNVDILTDSNGHYKIMVPAGSGRFGLDEETLLPNYLSPGSRVYTIGENDSLVDNELTNFKCYTVNDSITGNIFISAPHMYIGTYLISGWVNEISSITKTINDPLTGKYKLPVHRPPSNQIYTYSVNIASWDDRYPWPRGMYPDTSYWGILPGASNINFTFLPAETAAVDPFYGNFSPFSNLWEYYQYNHTNTGVQCVNDRLEIIATNQGAKSGVGIISRKPFIFDNREFRIYVDHATLGTENSIAIVFLNEKINWMDPLDREDYLMLSYSKKQNGGGWKLERKVNWNRKILWESNNLTGGHILFQFNEDASILTLKIDGVVKYQGLWYNNFSITYFHLMQFNSYPNLPTPVYFDEFFVGAVGSTGVKEITGNLPSEFRLEQNYPNPFNPITSIKFQLPIESSISIKLFNILGQEVKVLLDQEMKAGTYEISLDASNLPSGVYYYQLKAFDMKTGKILMNDTKKALLLK